MTSFISLGISPTIIAKLSEADFHNDSDISNLKPTELAAAANISIKESAEVIRSVSSKSNVLLNEAITMKELIEKEDDLGNIVTFCESLDELLGGGIPVKAITEVVGAPGIGKTQLCLQVCVCVQLTNNIGGLEGEAVYIDTEGSFNILRLKEMAEWAEKHVRQIHGTKHTEGFNTNSILKGVYYFRCHTHLELIAVVKHLPSLLLRHERIRLIVIDSVAFHFRHDFTDMAARSSVLCTLTQDLIQLANSHNLAVLVTNQMTTKVDSIAGSVSRGRLVAALGESWAHCPTLRLLLRWHGTTRNAALVKAPHRNNCVVQFQITAGGIRGRMTDVGESSDKGEKRKFCDT